MSINKIVIEKFENEENWTILVYSGDSLNPKVYHGERIENILSSKLYKEIIVRSLMGKIRKN